MNIGNLRATNDAEMRKIGPSPSGCGENRAILRCHPRQWGRHSVRPPPRLARFSLTTPPARKLITGSIASVARRDLRPGITASPLNSREGPRTRVGWATGRDWWKRQVSNVSQSAGIPVAGEIPSGCEGLRFEFCCRRGLVEAAGVEPASEIVVSQETPCSVQFQSFAPDA
jgi:hypothetical protein